MKTFAKVICQITFLYGVMWMLQEGTEVTLAVFHNRSPEWLVPSPFNCPNHRDYDWGWPRCHLKKEQKHVAAERDHR